jgi:hypothetical protein
MEIGLLGASFDTGNMGVNAIAESTIKFIPNRWPHARIILLDSGRKIEEEKIRIGDKELRIKKLFSQGMGQKTDSGTQEVSVQIVTFGYQGEI